MERLTFRTENNAALSKWLGEGHPCYGCEPAGSCSGCGFGKIIDRLSAYEDTGLMPEEISKLPASYQQVKAERERVKAERERAVEDISLVARYAGMIERKCI